MPAPRFLVRTLLHPLYERLRGRPTNAWYRRMRAADTLSPAALQDLHDRLLVEHLRHAAATVPFYRSRVPLESIRGPGDLQRFPVLDKAAVREAGRSLVSEPWRERVYAMETGGSSGEPLRYFTDHHREAASLANKLRARMWWDVPPGHREACLWGSPIETGRQDWLRRLADRVMGRILLSAFDITDVAMEAWTARLRGMDVLYGYASVLGRYARWLLEHGREPPVPGPRLVVTTAETLFPDDRRAVEEAFGCPVADEYGCRDGGLVAHESPYGMHLLHDSVHVEVLDEKGGGVPPGDTGEAVLTNLHAGGCPMIRYRLGDRMALEPGPPQGPVPHPRVRSLGGRVTDTLVRPDGRKVHGLALIYVLRELPGVVRFRCVQEDRESLRVEVVPGPGFDTGRIGPDLVERVHRVMGDGLRVDVQVVDGLEPLPSGKHRYVLCRVPD